MLCLSQINDKIELLKKDYEDKVAQKEELGNRAKMLQLKLERAGKIVSGLGGEKDRWEASVEVSMKRRTAIYLLPGFHVGRY